MLAKTVQFIDDRFPVINFPGIADFKWSQFQLAGIRAIFCNLLFCLFYSYFIYTCIFHTTGKIKIYACRRKTVFVITRSVFQISLYAIIFFCYFYFLDKSCLIGKISHSHSENRVHHVYLLTFWKKFTYNLGALYFIHVKCSRNRTSVFQFCRIDMPSFVYSGIKNYFSLSFRNFIPFSFKLYRVLYLCQNRNCHYGCQQPAK